ncbi:GNAT family N-acetyltransferase [candidate division KSB1 bacterium]|nr:GNAT family N-acetyltransferase [candidate division KSB1 bacterium]
MDSIQWQWSSFEKLTCIELYKILKARQDVFVVEQNCPFHEIDGLDPKSWHLAGWSGESLAAYARVVFPGARFPEPSIGRICTTQKWRGKGTGKELMRIAIRRTLEKYPESDIILSAQVYLDRFYRGFSFFPVGEPYDEDGILHVDMLRKFNREL